MTKNLNYMINFLCKIKILLLKILKLLKIPVFPVFFSKFLEFQVFPGYFCLNSQIPGFSRIPGKVATLYNKKYYKLKTLQISKN